MRRSTATSGPAAAGPLQTTPWSLDDFARLARFEIPSFIAIVACFVGAKHTETWDNQLYWIVGATLWLSADLRDEWRKLDSIEEALRDEHPVADEVAVG